MCCGRRLITAKSAQLADKKCWGDKTCGRCVNYKNMIKSTIFIHSWKGKVLFFGSKPRVVVTLIVVLCNQMLFFLCGVTEMYDYSSSKYTKQCSGSWWLSRIIVQKERTGNRLNLCKCLLWKLNFALVLYMFFFKVCYSDYLWCCYSESTKPIFIVLCDNDNKDLFYVWCHTERRKIMTWVFFLHFSGPKWHLNLL